MAKFITIIEQSFVQWPVSTNEGDLEGDIDAAKRNIFQQGGDYVLNNLDAIGKDFMDKHHGILDSGNMQTVAKVIQHIKNKMK